MLTKMSEKNYCIYSKATGKILSLSRSVSDTDAYVILNDAQYQNFKSNFWKFENFKIIDNHLEKCSEVAEIKDSDTIILSEIDCIFISYDEPNAEYNWADLLNKAPWAKRIAGVRGSDAAHKAAAEISTTERFITVDADNLVDEKFFDIVLDLIKKPELRDKQLSWCGQNIVNNLVYGNGGLKCWTKHFVHNMKTHEIAEKTQDKIDFCWNDQYKQLGEIYSKSYINSTPKQAWRAGFREGVKMTVRKGMKFAELENPAEQLDRRNYERLLIWCSVGSDVKNGLWSIYGARMGCYMINCTDWDYTKVADFDYLNNLFDSLDIKDPIEGLELYGGLLKKKINLPLTFFNAEQSKFFKELYTNPSRRENIFVPYNWDKN